MVGIHAGPRPCVVLGTARAAWEPALLGLLAEAGMVVVRRCVDLADLLAVVAAGQADVAVLSADLAGLDADALRRLEAHEVRPLVVAEVGIDTDRVRRLGVPLVESPDEVPAAIEALLAAPARTGVRDGAPTTVAGEPGTADVVAVWGPHGAPGRTTVALGLAAAWASRPHGAGVALLDVDPWGGSLAQALGILDETSGLLAAARLAHERALDEHGLAACLRQVSPGLAVLTGLPRADRWIEVRPGVVEEVVSLAAARARTVVLDCGFSVEREGTGLERTTATLEALGAATSVVVVGSAEPVGLSRLVRALVEIGDTLPGATVQVVVNRMRDSLGWSAREVVAMIEGFRPEAPVHLLPLDTPAVDRAAREGRPVTDQPASPVGRGVLELAEAILPAGPQEPKRRYSPAKV